MCVVEGDVFHVHFGADFKSLTVGPAVWELGHSGHCLESRGTCLNMQTENGLRRPEKALKSEME